MYKSMYSQENKSIKKHSNKTYNSKLYTGINKEGNIYKGDRVFNPLAYSCHKGRGLSNTIIQRKPVSANRKPAHDQLLIDIATQFPHLKSAESPRLGYTPTDETSSNTQEKAENVINNWHAYLGAGIKTKNIQNIEDPNRLFSDDNKKSIRFSEHERGSIGTTKAHYHKETWRHPLVAGGQGEVDNQIQRIQ